MSIDLLDYYDKMRKPENITCTAVYDGERVLEVFPVFRNRKNLINLFESYGVRPVDSPMVFKAYVAATKEARTAQQLPTDACMYMQAHISIVKVLGRGNGSLYAKAAVQPDQACCLNLWQSGCWQQLARDFTMGNHDCLKVIVKHMRMTYLRDTANG